MAILSALDNTDKHRMLHPGFAFPTAKRGVDLIDVRDRNRVLGEHNVWTSGQPIEHVTVMARYIIRGSAEGVLRVDPKPDDKLLRPLDPPRTTYEDMIARVRTIADKAIDSSMPRRSTSSSSQDESPSVVAAAGWPRAKAPTWEGSWEPWH
jgi:hypothetical protein